jgi:hypothetical protein
MGEKACYAYCPDNLIAKRRMQSMSPNIPAQRSSSVPGSGTDIICKKLGGAGSLQQKFCSTPKVPCHRSPSVSEPVNAPETQIRHLTQLETLESQLRR